MHLGQILLAVIMVFGTEAMRERASKKGPDQVGFLAGLLRAVECLALNLDFLFWVCWLSAVVPILSFQFSAFLRLHSSQHLFDQSLQPVSL